MPLTSDEQEKLEREEKILEDQRKKIDAIRKLAPSEQPKKAKMKESAEVELTAPDAVQGMHDKDAVEITKRFKPAQLKIKNEGVKFAKKAVERAHRLNPLTSQQLEFKQLAITYRKKADAYIQTVTPHLIKIQKELKNYERHLLKTKSLDRKLDQTKLETTQILISKVEDITSLINQPEKTYQTIIIDKIKKLAEETQNDRNLNILSQSETEHLNNPNTNIGSQILFKIKSAWQSIKNLFAPDDKNLTKKLKTEANLLKTHDAPVLKSVESVKSNIDRPEDERHNFQP